MNQGDPILVTTVHRGVFFGYYESHDGNRFTITKARNCIYWPSENRGFLGLASDGPASGSRVGPAAEKLELFDVTAVVAVSPPAVKRWEDAPWE